MSDEKKTVMVIGQMLGGPNGVTRLSHRDGQPIWQRLEGDCLTDGQWVDEKPQEAPASR